MVKILLDQKVFQDDIQRQHPSTKNSPLHEATLSGNADIVDILIKRIGGKDKLFKALTDKECQNSDEMSPIHIACRDKHFDIAKKFFDCINQNDDGIDRTDDCIDRNGDRNNRNDDSIDQNYDGIDRNDDCIDRNEVKLEVLANSTGKKQSSPLHYACQGGNKRIVELLLKHNADITSNENGTFPIHIVARYGHCHLVDEVLRRKSVNVVDKHQNTPLNIATRYNKVEMIEELLKKR